MTSMRESFLEAIKQDRYDVATRMAFADWLMENGFDDEAKIQREWTPKLQKEAEDFFDEYADIVSHEGYDDGNYTSILTKEDVIDLAREFLRTGERHCLPFVTPDVCYNDRKKFWKYFQVLTGIPVSDDDHGVVFRCAC